MPRTYACCYCNQKFNRNKLPRHMEKHADEIPENLTPYQVAYDIINNHPDHHGRCVICNQPTGWSEKNQKYHRICKKESCRQAIKKTYQERMMKVYNKPHLMDDVNHLEKMLAHRKISGKYKWSDGTEFTYTGSYEKNFLEFLDKVMNYESREIISPGPVLEYDYKGKKHKWITDVMILPYNLIVEIKDGGDNKNGNKAWKGTREKTIAKEVMITNLGKYNYIRLTNNDFAQFLGIIAELKMQIVDDTVSPLYRIHENTSLDEDVMHDLCTKTLTAQNIRAAANNVKSIFTGTGKADGGFWIKGGKTKEGKLTLFERIVQMPAEAICRVILIPASITADGILAIIIGTMKLMQKKDAAGKVFKQDLINLKKQISEIEKRTNDNKDPKVIDKLNQLKSQYNSLSKKYSNQSVKEDSLPEAIDNPYMLREAQEWEHLTHMWSNAIDDIIGNVANSPFEVAKGSYIDHDPETGKEVCVMRTIRPKAELKNREYRDRLKKQMYHLQQKINKAYNVHPSVMFIQYPIDNTNLTEGLIIGITKTSR